MNLFFQCFYRIRWMSTWTFITRLWPSCWSIFPKAPRSYVWISVERTLCFIYIRLKRLFFQPKFSWKYTVVELFFAQKYFYRFISSFSNIFHGESMTIKYFYDNIYALFICFFISNCLIGSWVVYLTTF